MNSDLALMLSEEVLRLKEDSNGAMTINQALEEIVRQYKISQGLNTINNYNISQNQPKFKVGDKYINSRGDMIGTIKKVYRDDIVFSQHSPVYHEFDYPDKTIEVKVIEDLIERELLIKI